MSKKISIAIAAGLFLAGPALAGDQDQTRTEDQLETKDQLKTQDQLQIRDRLLTAEEGATGAGEQVRTMAQARARVHAALAEQAGMPADESATMPGEGSGEKAAERHAVQARKMATERAALRHAERTAARERVAEGKALGKGAGSGRGGMAGAGPGNGDCTQAAETTRSGAMRGAGATPGGMMR